MPEEAKKCITEEKQVEAAKATLERINSWINNCDTKAGAILALLGVILTLVMMMLLLATLVLMHQKVMEELQYGMLVLTLKSIRMSYHSIRKEINNG